MELILTIACAFYCIGVFKFSLLSLRNNEHIKSFIGFTYLFLLTCHLINILYSNCHLLLGCTIAPPGSFITRGLVIETSTFLRRMIEPSMVIIIFCQVYLTVSADRKTGSILRTALLIIILTLLGESFILANPISFEKELLITKLAPYLIPLCWSSAFILAGYGLFKGRIDRYRTNQNPTLVMGLYLAALFLGFFNINNIIFANLPAKIAAHYYVWFPENWIAGYGEIDSELKSKPLLGEYLSDDVGTIKNHFEQFKQNKIDYIFLDWWPTKRSLRNRAKFFVNNIPNDSEVKFALHFETQGIDTNEHFLNINEKNTNKLEAYFVYLAKTFFAHPNYLSINGKKVVNIYITRHILGDLNQAIQRIRENVRNETGDELYLIGDEAFFNVVSGSNDQSQILLHEYIPEWTRINALDAITLYNPYDPTFDYGETPNEIQESFLTRTKDLYREYYKIATTAGKPFIPTIIPGYNDKAIRPKENHLIIPRQINSTNTFQTLKNSATETIANENYNLITITSWNEWNEGTYIEASDSR